MKYIQQTLFSWLDRKVGSGEKIEVKKKEKILLIEPLEAKYSDC